MYSPSDTRLEWPGEGPLFESNLNACLGLLLKSCLRPFARYGTGVNHYQMQLNIFIKFVKIT